MCVCGTERVLVCCIQLVGCVLHQLQLGIALLLVSVCSCRRKVRPRLVGPFQFNSINAMAAVSLSFPSRSEHSFPICDLASVDSERLASWLLIRQTVALNTLRPLINLFVYFALFSERSRNSSSNSRFAFALIQFITCLPPPLSEAAWSAAQFNW